MSVRRSSRTTKGVHSQRLDLEYAQEPRTSESASNKRVMTESGTVAKKAKTLKSGSRQPAWVKIEGESVRCLPCGTTDLNYNEDEEDPHGMMIECDRCNTWQHVKCMFGTKMKEKDIPDDYKCDVCDPLNPQFAKLRRKLSYARYLRLRLHPDEEVGDESLDTIDEIEQDAGAINDDKNDQEYNEGKSLKKAASNGASLNSDDELSGDNEKENLGKSRKRPMKKNIKISSPNFENDSKKSTTSPAYDAIRTRIVKNLELKLVELLPKTNNENILRGKTIGELAREWATILEKGIHESFPNYKADHTKYTDKARSLLTNLKISRLVDRVISGEFTIEQLPKLTTEEMRTPEEKKKAEEVRQQALNQVVIKNDISTLPKTRLTHRGEEIIGDTDYQFDINDRRNVEVEKIKERMKKEELEKQGLDQENNFENPDKFDQIRSPPQFMMGTNSDDDEEVSNMQQSSHISEAFDDENFSVGGISDNKNENIAPHDLLDDDDFDNILNDNLGKGLKDKSTNDEKKQGESRKKKDDKQRTEKNVKIVEPEETDSSNQRSAKDMWQGTLGSPELSFSCKIDFVSSTCKPTKRNIIESAYRIVNENAVATNGYINKGRLNAQVADDYLDKITTSRDLYLFEVLPSEKDDQNGALFMKMWSYYHSSAKYAVLKNTVSYIKDAYLLALSREMMIDGEESAIILNKFPSDEIMEHLEESQSESKLYIVFVVQRDMDKVKPIRIPPKKAEVSSGMLDQTKRSENENEERRKVITAEEKIGGGGDEDYDPALSVTLSKLTASSSSQSAPDQALASLMKNLS